MNQVSQSKCAALSDIINMRIVISFGGKLIYVAGGCLVGGYCLIVIVGRYFKVLNMLTRRVHFHFFHKIVETKIK